MSVRNYLKTFQFIEDIPHRQLRNILIKIFKNVTEQFAAHSILKLCKPEYKLVDTADLLSMAISEQRPPENR